MVIWLGFWFFRGATGGGADDHHFMHYKIRVAWVSPYSQRSMVIWYVHCTCLHRLCRFWCDTCCLWRFPLSKITKKSPHNLQKSLDLPIIHPIISRKVRIYIHPINLQKKWDLPSIHPIKPMFHPGASGFCAIPALHSGLFVQCGAHPKSGDVGANPSKCSSWKCWKIDGGFFIVYSQEGNRNVGNSSHNRIHGAGILMVNVTINIAYMDPVLAKDKIVDSRKCLHIWIN